LFPGTADNIDLDNQDFGQAESKSVQVATLTLE